MTRDGVQAVTRLPLLIPALGSAKPDGWLYCWPSRNSEWAGNVRIVSDADVRERVRKFPQPDRALWFGVADLRNAINDHDERLLQRGWPQVRPWLESHIKHVRTDWDFGPLENPLWEKRVESVYAMLRTRLVRDARMVMWLSESQWLPGIFCPDWRTAAFAVLVWNRVRVCPRCGNPFVPKPSTQMYCLAAHRDAHRMARKRWRKRHANDRK